MNLITKTGRIFYCVAMIAVAIQQLYYGDFCPMFFPPWPGPIPGYALAADLFSIAMITANILIIFKINGRTSALILGGVLLLMLFLGWVPYQYLVFPHKKTHLGVWELPLKELALAGGAFCIAGSFSDQNNSAAPRGRLIVLLEQLVPFGPLFFSTTMICFGICHFLYTPPIAAMVPSWIPAHYFWTYFAAIALIGAGAAIGLRVGRKPAALLLGTMIFLWFILLHAPNAVQDPLGNKGNAVFSAFSALAFSGIALVISGGDRKKTRNDEKNMEY